MLAVNKIRARMTELGLTQSEVAKRLGVSHQTLSYKLNGKTDFKISEIEALCKILNIKNKNAYFFTQ